MGRRFAQGNYNKLASVDNNRNLSKTFDSGQELMDLSCDDEDL